MNQVSFKSTPFQSIKEVWFLTSELEGERASSFRQERWCRIFLESNATLRIFNLRGAFDHSDVTCNTNDELIKFRKNGIDHYKGPKASVREGLLVRFIRRIKHITLVDLYLPNVIKLFFHLHRLLKSRTKPIVIMASSPPFSVAVVGALIKWLHDRKVIFVVDMRDAWALHNALGGIKPLKRIIEKKVLRIADHVATVSYGLAEEFKRYYNVDVHVMYNVATHYLDSPKSAAIEWQQVSKDINPGRRQIVYTGSTPQGHYDLNSIVSAMVILRKNKPELANKIQLIFVGACDEVRRLALSHAVPEDDIVFIGHLPHAVSRSVQASAHALIFLAHFGPKNAGVVSTKLFEYLCLNKPVLPFGLHQGSDVDILLNRYCGKSLYLHNAKEIAATLERIAKNELDFLPILDNAERIRELLVDYQNFSKIVLANRTGCI